MNFPRYIEPVTAGDTRSIADEALWKPLAHTMKLIRSMEGRGSVKVMHSRSRIVIGGGGFYFYDNFDLEPAPGNVTETVKWQVDAVDVDIIGSGPGGTFVNVLPGNGYYIDLAGSAGGAVMLAPKNSTPELYFNLKKNRFYTLTLWVAGNNRLNQTNAVIARIIGATGGGIHMEQTITITNYLMPITRYVFRYRQPVDEPDGQISIADGSGIIPNSSIGALLMAVEFKSG